MFTNIIINMLEGIFSNITNFAGESSALISPMNTYNEQIFNWSKLILENVMMPVSTTILALFALLELHRASLKMDSMGSSGMPAEIVIKILFRVAMAKIALDSIPIIMQALYNLTTYLTTRISSFLQVTEITGIDVSQYRDSIEDLDFGQQLGQFSTCFLVKIITWIATKVASIIVSARFIEIYLYFAVSPIPAATFLSDEHSQIGKNFLKSFAAACLQGTLIYIVLSFFPILMGGALADSTAGIDGALSGAMGYSLVLVVSIFSTGKWSKSIVGAS